MPRFCPRDLKWAAFDLSCGVVVRTVPLSLSVPDVKWFVLKEYANGVTVPHYKTFSTSSRERGREAGPRVFSHTAPHAPWHDRTDSVGLFETRVGESCTYAYHNQHRHHSSDCDILVFTHASFNRRRQDAEVGCERLAAARTLRASHSGGQFAC